eukprot:6805771-Ditylum_brightwellii.AAC.1
MKTLLRMVFLVRVMLSNEMLPRVVLPRGSSRGRGGRKKKMRIFESSSDSDEEEEEDESSASALVKNKRRRKIIFKVHTYSGRVRA